MIRNLSILLLLVVSCGLSAQDQEAARSRIIRQWNLSSDFTEEVIIPFDTIFSLCHQYRISDKYSDLNATLGSYGLPFYQINFFDRINDPDKYLYTGYYPFMHLPDNAVFMNTQIPFSEMIWTYGAPREISEQTFRVRHSQNVNRYLNFGLVFDVIYNLGQYSYQKTDHKTATFFGSYTAPKYKAYISAGINNMSSLENGGITEKEDLEIYDTREVPVNLGALNAAKNILKNRNMLVVQRYTIGNRPAQPDTSKSERSGKSGFSGTFSHILIWENNRGSYTDQFPLSGFYDTTFINSSLTFDSLYSRNLKNTIRFDFTTDESRKVRLGGGVGLRNELFRYSQILPTHDTNFADTVSWKQHNNILTGKIFNDIGRKFGWVVYGDLFLTGYRAGDFRLKGKITKSFVFEQGNASWIITGGITNTQPSFWYEQWGGNNIEWHNKMKKEFRIDLGTAFTYPARNTELRFNYAIIDNYTDFNTLALPSQHYGGLSVVSINMKKELKAWKFHLAGDVLLQKSSNSDILDLPLFSTRTTFFLEHMLKFKQTNGRLNTQLGIEVLYHSLYYPYTYMPCTDRFLRQDKVKTGNYPFIDVFLNVKLKRTRIFVMVDHLNSGYMGYDYFMIPSYPMNIRMLRYGIAWTFYN
jgi:hypothetical protein